MAVPPDPMLTHTLTHPPAPMPPRRPPRRSAAAGVLVAVVVLHLGLAGFWRHVPPAPPGQPVRVAMQVLRVDAVPAGRPDMTADARADIPTFTPVPAATPHVPTMRLTPAPVPVILPAVPSPTPAAVPAAEPTGGAATAGDEDTEAEALTGTPGATAPPLYATRLPPSVQLSFTLQRGGQRGEAWLQWRQDGDRYALQFDARLARGLPLIEQRSAGQIDANGLAPERFTDRRRGRSAQAANFQRDTGRITFSGPRTDHPAWPGAQDRLGWIVQLAAIFSAAQQPLQEVSIFVVGARGGAGLWTFRLQGRETLQTALGPVEALYLRRDPERAEDQRVEAWLDPARGFWPVRLRSTPMRGGEPLDLLLAAEPQRP